MTLTVFFLLLFAALLHASWNAIVKSATDKLYSAISVTASATLIALVLLPFSPQPAAASLPFLLASCILQILYTLLVANTYRLSDMSQTYPIMRGTAPLLVASFSVLILGDRLSFMSWLGIIVICISILLMAFNGLSQSSRGLRLALLNAGVIAAYTLVDGTGVRLSATAFGYTLWTFFLNGFCLFSWVMLTRPREASHYLRQNWHTGLFGGAATMGSYGIALWAMTQAPLAVVAALRESSIIFGVLIAFFFLKENVSVLRICAAMGIVAGAILLRIA